MEWYSGAIPAAIHQSKIKKTVFVVYIRGSDDLSKEMDETWNSVEVVDAAKSTGIVAIKVEAKSETSAQFSAIYPVVTVPASYFIGNNGAPIAVIAGTKSVTELVQIITDVSKTHASDDGGESRLAPSSAAASGSSHNDTDASAASHSEPMAASAETSQMSLEAKARRAREVLDRKRLEKARQEHEDLRNKEKERRELGRGLNDLKQLKEEQEAKEVQDQIRKDREEEKKAKEKVKEQIAKDREERHQRYSKEKAEKEAALDRERATKLRNEQEAKDRESAQKSAVARVQFRMTDGSFVTEQFASTVPLQSAREFIAQRMGWRPDSFRLCVPYPRREFTAADMDQSLASLGLAPSAAIMVLPPPRGAVVQRSAGENQSYLMMLLAPIFALWNFFYALIFATAPTSSSSNAPQRAAGSMSPNQSSRGQHSTSAQTGRDQANPRKRAAASSRQDGNVHRLTREDEDDDMNTWNGNSTQQL